MQSWHGDNLVQTTSRTVGQVRSGIRTAIVPQTVRQSLGSRVISVALYHLLEVERYLLKHGMRPNTRVYAFFDNVDVSSYITPNGGSLGGNIITNAQ